MSYSVRFEGTALIQLNGLPADAFNALLERVTNLVDQPWDATVMPPGRDPVGLEYSIVAVTCFFSWQRGPVMQRSGTRV